MEDLKEIIADEIFKAINISQMNIEDIKSKIEVPKEKANGDFAYPCFTLAKYLKKSPVMIANQIKEKIGQNSKFSKIEVVNGYLNFYTNSEEIVQKIISEILDKKEEYGSCNIGNGKNVCIDYSSPNIAKPFHLGHLRTTIIGRTLYNLYKELGYRVIGINYLGDWGRQFGLVIEGYKRFKDEYNIVKDPLHSLSDMYVRASNLAKDDETVMDMARDNFKKLEEGNEEYLKLWKYFREVSLKEYERIYNLLDCKFDSYNGESYYNDKMDEVIDILTKKGVLKESNGAKVVFLKDNEPPCIIVKSNGSTIYATRDLAAILDRARTFDYEKSIYVTSYEQIHHFEQVFEVAKYLVDEKYTKDLVHVPYGMVRLKDGKMSTREGTVVYLQDLIEESIKRAKKIIEQKNNPEIEDIDELATKIGVGALVFNNIKHNKIKDIIFDLDETLRFDGETGPYIQYMYVRIKSILEKSKIEFSSLNNIDYTLLKKQEEIELAKELAKLPNVILQAAQNYEPSILARYVIDVASLFSSFYNNCPVLIQDENLKKARCSLIYAVSIVMEKCLKILGIKMPDKM